MEKEIKRVVLSKVIEKSENEHYAEVSLDELELLVDTAGGEVFCQVVQKKDRIDPVTYLGSGKIKELKEVCENNDIDIVVFDDELSPSQINNISEIVENVEILDRSMLILDIFAKRATSNEGKLQVELAQMQYTMPRLYGQGKYLSKQGAGIGTRGPGETKLELDRRYVKGRINTLKEKLEELEKNRNIQRAQRDKNDTYQIAIAGYTNAGKSSLMNLLTDSGVLAENKLFATLETTTRKLTLPDGEEVLITDTVGFIRNLPHQFIEAFKSTLNEITYADLILLVCDAGDDEHETQIKITEELIHELSQKDIPIIYVYNKIDTLQNPLFNDNNSNNNRVMISVKENKGIDELLNLIVTVKNRDKIMRKYIIPNNKGYILDTIYKTTNVISVEYKNDCIEITTMANNESNQKIESLLK